MSLVPVDEAIARIIAGATPLPAENVALAAALGRRLAEPLRAKRTQPPFPASAMDGYAVRAADVTAAGARLTVIGMAAAGHGYRGTVGAGRCVRIFTGAPVPEGADAILIQENAETVDATTIVAREGVLKGRHIRSAGFDFVEGETLLDAGRLLGMRELAVAAAMGYADVPVRRKPKVAIVATGDELVPPSVAPGPDQIVASNGFGVAAHVATVGGEPLDLGIVPDNVEAIGRAIDAASASGADILVTLGGASVGDHDLVRGALMGRGMELDFWRIAMRPGKPLMFGRMHAPAGERAMRVLGLPGNPVSSLVCAILFLTPLVNAMLGVPYADPSEPAIAGGDLPPNDARQDYLRALSENRQGSLPIATPLPLQDSSALAAFARANCLIVRPPHAPAGPAGVPCRIIRLP